MLSSHFPKPAHQNDHHHWGSATGASAALSIHEQSRLHPGLTLVLTADPATASRLRHEIAFFSGTSPDGALHTEKKTDCDDEHTVTEQLHFPDWEILPYDIFSPHQDIISERLYTLHRLPRVEKAILIVSVSTLMHRLMPAEHLSAHSLVLNKGMKLNLARYSQILIDAGYLRTQTVTSHGQFAIRGSIIDLFPMGSTQPFRIDLFDDTLDSFRTFDPESQRSTGTIDEIHLLPAREYPLTSEGIQRFKEAFQNEFEVNLRRCPVYQDITAGIPSPGSEYYLPLFFSQTSTLFDYLPANTLLFTAGDIQQAGSQFWTNCTQRYENHCVDPGRPILAPSRLFLDLPGVNQQLKQLPRISLDSTVLKEKGHCKNLPNRPLPALNIKRRESDPLSGLRSLSQQAERVLLVAESAGRQEQLSDLLSRHDIRVETCDSWQEFLEGSQPLALTTAQIDTPLWLLAPNIALITEHQLFDSQVMQRRRRAKVSDDFSDHLIQDLTELKNGAPVVHIDNGVGRYIGLQTLGSAGEYEQEFLVLQYAGEAKLYVPVTSLHLIARYTGASDEMAPLHRLGNEQWKSARKKAEEKARDVAAELLDVYARREAQQRQPIEKPSVDYFTFTDNFPFEETPDQAQTIEAVMSDMQRSYPMDRLVCGDVGFGKTEVAMRACFLAAHNGRQVVVLTPTTLLAQQHLESFQDRFAGWPFTIEVLSRFRTATEVARIQEQIADGSVDIVIGTHKLLNSAVNFKSLGLVVIDEEHRFGVRQKEKLKTLRTHIDILALTATPIPRTLNLALSRIRDLSIIATPPARRLSIKTFVRPDSPTLIREAAQRELMRGGQIYYLHNDVKTIEKAARDLQELLPDARIAVGHGQMRESALEKVMQSFYHKHYNILVCTTIIETGIDIPNANTIIIHRADKLGLAQLHQLRGRVGRSHHQAYAYLLTPPDGKNMTTEAKKRLEAIEQANTLGAGFMLASQDLEIRGAGELLGEEQSGQIQTIGFSLYTDMLDRAVLSLKQAGTTGNFIQPEQSSSAVSLFSGTDINLNIPTLLPEQYIRDVHTRLVLYKKISAAKSSAALRELQVELIDRFGLLPEPAKYLFRLMEIKLKAAPLNLKRIEFSQRAGKIEFQQDSTIDPAKLVSLVQNQPDLFQLDYKTMTLKYTNAMESADQRLSSLEKLIIQLVA